MTAQLTGCLVATPFHPQGTVLTEWALYTLKDVMATQSPPGMRLGFYWRNHGEDCATAYSQLVRYAWRNQIPFLFIIEDDLFIPDGALQALFYELGKAENADVAGIGGVYSWREGPVGKPFPLVFPKEGLGPKLDYTPGDIVEVDAAGQGFFLLRTEALATQPEPWFAMDWQPPDDPIPHTEAADMFFFRKLRSGQAPSGKPWRVLVHTGLVAEHVDRNDLEMSPPEWDREYRERYGYAVESELIRRVVRLRAATGKGRPKGVYPSLINEFGMSFGQAARVVPVAFEGPTAPDRPIARAVADVQAHRIVAAHAGDAPPTEPFRILSVGSGGCQLREDLRAMLPQLAGDRPVVIDHNEHEAGAAHLSAALGVPKDRWVIADAATLEGVPDAHYDLVYANHVAEHLPIALLVSGIRNWWRVVKPHGQLFIAVPDVSTIGQYVLDGKLDVVLYRAAGLDITPRLILNGGQRYPGDAHLNTLDMRSLRNACYAAGISERECWIGPGGLYECQAVCHKGIDLVGARVRARIQEFARVPDPPVVAPAPRPAVAAALDLSGNGKEAACTH